MSMTEYKTMGGLFVKHNICDFLKNHGNKEINITDEYLMSVAKDIFRNNDEQIKDVRLYEAINRFSTSGVLFGRYMNYTPVKKAMTTVTFIRTVCEIYNLLVKLDNSNKCVEYNKIIDALDSIDILIRTIPNNIDYVKLSAEVSKIYLNTVLEFGCERAVLAAIDDDASEKQETKS